MILRHNWNPMRCCKVYFGLSSSMLKYKDLLEPESFILKKLNPTPYRVFVAENIRRVKQEQPYKAMTKLAEDYKSLSIGELLKYEEKAEKLTSDIEKYRKMVEDLPLDAKDELLSTVLEKTEKRIKSKAWKEHNKPILKSTKVVSLVPLTEEDLLSLPNAKGREKGFNIMKKREEKWKTLSEDEKERLKAVREKEKSIYVEELSKWTVSLIESKDMDEILPILEMNEMKMVLDHFAGFKPTRARSAKQLYMFSDLGKEHGVTFKNVSKLFKILPKEQMEAFTIEAEKEKARAADERKQWHDNLEQKGLKKLIHVWKELCSMHGKRSNVHS